MQEFLDAIFSRSGDGYLRVIEVRPGYDNMETAWNASVHSYYAVRGGSVQITKPFNQTSEWYFNPALLRQPEGRGTKDNILQGSVLWCDIDQVGVNPFDLPLHPSIIINSSPGKHHVYWLLNVALDADNLDHWNRRVSYAIHGADIGTWNCNRVLRLPEGVNLKYDTPTPVRIAYIDRTRVYSISDFEVFPAVSTLLSIVKEEPIPVQLEQKYMLQKHADVLTYRLKTWLVRKQPDRSKALWAIYHECYRLNISKEDCYNLVHDSPNNKFASDKRTGDAVLWREICRAYADEESGKAGRGILEQISSTFASKEVPTRDKLTLVGDMIVADMERNGAFYKHSTGGPFFYLTRAHEVVPIERRSINLAAFLVQEYGINAGTQEYPAIFNQLQTAAIHGEQLDTHTMAYYSRETNTLYVNRFDGWMYRITADEITPVRNGTDKVLFLTQSWCNPFEIRRSGEKRDLLQQHIFDNIEAEAAVGDSRDLVRGWFFALFFPQLFRVRPILAMIGPAGSGKTFVFKSMLTTLFGGDITVASLPSSSKDFWMMLAHRQIAVFDNLDTHIPWLADAFALASTGHVYTTRRLYTDSDEVTYSINCFLGLTSRTPRFIRDDVAERCLPIRVKRREHFQSEFELWSAQLVDRNYMWAEILDELRGIVRKLQQNPIGNLDASFRQADFAKFLETYLDRDISHLIKIVQKAQAYEISEASPLVVALMEWLTHVQNSGREVNPDTLYLELQGTSISQQFKKQYPSLRGFTIAVAWNERYLSDLGVELVRKQNPVRYIFTQEGYADDSRTTAQTVTDSDTETDYN